MDRKSIFVIVLCIGFMFIWQAVFVPKYFSKPAPPVTQRTNSPAATTTGATGTTNGMPSDALAVGDQVRPTFSTNVAEQLLVLTNENAKYIFTSRGGGLKEVELVKFPQIITRKSELPSDEPNVATLNLHAHLPVLAILGDSSLIDDGEFTLTQTGTGVRVEKTLASGLRLVKEFEPSSNYLVHTSVRMENLTSNSITLPVQEWVIGTATPMGPFDDGMNVGLMWYDGKKTHETMTPYFDNKRFGCLPGTPRTEYQDGASNVVWVVAKNQFFGLLAMPQTEAQAVVARAIDMPRPTEGVYASPTKPLRKGFETALIYPAFMLPAGATATNNLNLYIGPKEYRTLAALAGRYNNEADRVMGFGFFGFFSKALLLAMNWLQHTLSISYGWAIIVLTILLKILFWPLTAASTRTSQKMAALAPEIKAIKEKYKDDPMKAQKKQMELFSQNNVRPVAGCLPMLVQLPVFFGLFMMLRTAIELRGASFLWAIDLSRADTIFTIPGLTFLPFSGPEGFPVNLMPLLYISSAIWQTHITPMSPSMDATQQKLMRWMPLFFLLFLYNFSSGLALYMTVNNLLTILQTWLMRRKYPVAAVVTTAAPSVLTPTSKKKK